MKNTQEKTGLDWWCDRAWIKFGLIVSAVMFALILINWNNWDTTIKIFAGIAVLVPIHVVEEWVFPGGFHYQYNVGLSKSDLPNAYPMSRVQDMCTNLLATFLYIILTFLCLFNEKFITGTLIMTIVFCGLELFMHTVMGVIMYFKLKNAGKTTIYGPGSITTYWVFVPLGVIGLYNLEVSAITSFDAIVAAVLLAILIAMIFLPVKFSSKEDMTFAFPDAKYYERFIH